MKYLLASLLFLSAAGAYAQDCQKSSEACAAPKKALSPFLAASAAGPADAVAPVQKPAAQKVSAPPAAKPAPVPAKVSPAAEAADAAAEPAPAGGNSSPAWLLFVAAMLAGLYFYLGAGQRKGKRK